MASVVLCVRFRVKPDKMEAFRAHLYQTIEAMKDEPAFVNSIVHEFIDVPSDLLLYEIWRGTRDTWMRDELNRPYRKPYEAGLADLIEQRTVEWLVPIGEWGQRIDRLDARSGYRKRD